MIHIVIDRIKKIGFKKTAFLITKRMAQALSGLKYTRIRYCSCCMRPSLFLCLGKGREAVRCIRCGANQRYELLAESINRHLGFPLENLDVVEFDPGSPLSGILNKSKQYIRTYYSENCSPGSIREDGARCEDLTKLTFEDCSLDLMISSDVLEHIPDVATAFEESARVLRKGGMHIFTVPTHDKTFRRAQIEDGKVVHLAEPEYHLDPLNEEGILAFWHFGITDFGDLFSNDQLRISILTGPVGEERRIVWAATKIH